MSNFDSCSLRLFNCLGQPRFDEEQAALNENSTMGARQPVIINVYDMVYSCIILNLKISYLLQMLVLSIG